MSYRGLETIREVLFRSSRIVGTKGSLVGNGSIWYLLVEESLFEYIHSPSL